MFNFTVNIVRTMRIHFDWIWLRRTSGRPCVVYIQLKFQRHKMLILSSISPLTTTRKMKTTYRKQQIQNNITSKGIQEDTLTVAAFGGEGGGKQTPFIEHAPFELLCHRERHGLRNLSGQY